MPWDEFKDLLAGLDPETPLGRMIRIRTENDENVLEHYTPEMRAIRNEWQKKIASERSEQEIDDFLASMQEMFKRMAGEEQLKK